MKKVLLTSVVGLALLTGCGQNEEPTTVVVPADSTAAPLAGPAVEPTPAPEVAAPVVAEPAPAAGRPGRPAEIPPGRRTAPEAGRQHVLVEAGRADALTVAGAVRRCYLLAAGSAQGRA